MKSWPIVSCEELHFIAVQNGNVVQILKPPGHLYEESEEGDESDEQEGDEYEGDEFEEQEGDEFEEQEGDESDEQEGDESEEQEGDESEEQEGDESDEQEGDESEEQEGDESEVQEGDESDEQDEFEEDEVHRFTNVNDVQSINGCLFIQYDNVHYSLIESKIWYFHDAENMKITKEINTEFMFTPNNPIRVSDDLHYYIVENNRVRSFLLRE